MINVKSILLVGNNVICLLASARNSSIDLSNVAEIVSLPCVPIVLSPLARAFVYIVCQSTVHACSGIGGSDDDANAFSSLLGVGYPPRATRPADCSMVEVPYRPGRCLD